MSQRDDEWRFPLPRDGAAPAPTPAASPAERPAPSSEAAPGAPVSPAAASDTDERESAPSDTDERESAPPSSAPVKPRPRAWVLNLVLFLATVYSVFEVGQLWNGAQQQTGFRGWLAGWPFALPLLAILVSHEFGHYFAARIHRVPASLPYFIPLPKLSPFGTFGAVIIMPKRIRSANALLDIGAAGPLAGIVVAIPMMIWGLALSDVGPRSASGYIQEGQSILYWLLKLAVFGPMRADQDVLLHPTALAAWAGFLVTFLNLLPFGQLDGGHVAYALWGEKQNRFARLAHLVPALLIVYNGWIFVRPLILQGLATGFGKIEQTAWLPVSAVTVWIGIFVLLSLMRYFSGVDHPPVDDEVLSPTRRIVAIITLALFVLLFMPTPWVVF